MTTATATTTTATTTSEFSMVCGGPFYWLMRKSGFTDELPGVIVRAAVFALIAWLPLMVLTFAQGLATGFKGAFFEDIQVHVRCFVAIPLLVFADLTIDKRFSRAVRYIGSAELVPHEACDEYHTAIAKMNALRDSKWEAWLVVPVAYLIALAEHRIGIAQAGSWKVVGDAPPVDSAAGYWYLAVTAPLTAVLILRWVWRLVLWTVLLFEFSRKLVLQPGHPDAAGGLGPVADAHSSLATVIASISSIVAAGVINQVHRGHAASALDFKHVMLVFIVLAPMICLAPLMVFAPVLMHTRRAFIMDYGVKAADHARRFDARWITSPTPIELGTSDMQTDADLGNSFARAHQMRSFLFLRPLAWQPLFLAALIPMILAAMTAVPLVEMLRQLHEVI